MGIDPDGDLGDLLVDEDTLRACFANHPLLSTSTFSRHTSPPSDPADAPDGAEDGSNLQVFKDLLSEADRDEDFVEIAVAALYLFDEEKAHHEDQGHTGTQTLGMGAILTKLENEGHGDERLDLFEGSAPLRDGLRAYAKLCLDLRMPKSEEDREAERNRDKLGEDRPGWEAVMQQHPSYDNLGKASTVADDIARIEGGGTEDEIRDHNVTQQAAIEDTDTSGEAVRRVAAAEADIVSIPAPPIPPRLQAELDRQADARAPHETAIRARARTSQERSQYLLHLFEVAVRQALEATDPTKATQEISTNRRDWFSRMVDNQLYEMITPHKAGVHTTLDVLTRGGMDLDRFRQNLGEPGDDVAYLRAKLDEQGLDPKNVDTDLLRLRDEEEAEADLLDEEPPDPDPAAPPSP